MMRILHTADWHLGRSLEGRSRLPEQVQFIDELVQIVEEERIDLILMAGDVYDTYNPPAEAEELFYESLTRLTAHGKRKIICIAGNHDHPDRLAAANPLAEAHGIYLLGLPNQSMLEIGIPSTQEVARIFALPYPSESRLREVLSKDIEEEQIRDAYDVRIARLFQQQESYFTADTVNLAMSHLFVQGGATSESEREIQVGGAYTVTPQSLPASAQYIALGHLHRPQNIKHAPTLARYSGSPLAYSFSETGYAKSVTVFAAKPNQPITIQDVLEIPLRSGKPLVTWEANEGIQQVYRWLDEGRDRDAWINVEIYVEEALPTEVTQHLRRSHAGILNVRPIYPEIVAAREQLRVSELSIEELFHRFYQRQTNGAVPDEELVKLFLELLQEDDESCAPSI